MVLYQKHINQAFLGINSLIANLTQSAGVPEQLYSTVLEFFDVILDVWRVEFIVYGMSPFQTGGLSGATTNTSPISFITLIKVLIPGAFYTIIIGY